MNAILFFEPEARWGTQISLLYNRIGRRLSTIGVDDFPDVFEEPRETLELSLSQRLAGGLKARFAARNLTDARVVQTQAGVEIRRYQPGRNYTFGISYAF